MSPSPPPELEDSGDYFEEEEDEIARQVQEEPSDDELFDPTQTPSKRKARLAKERAQKARQQAEELRRPKVLFILVAASSFQSKLTADKELRQGLLPR